MTSTAAASPVEVRLAPPQQQREERPAPRPGYVWIPGYWDWQGARYTWVSGRWAPERRGCHWVPHRWVSRDGRWVMHPGGWVLDEGTALQSVTAGLAPRP